MKRSAKFLFGVVVGLWGLFAFAADNASTESGIPADPGWPRVIDRNGIRLVYYQPQIDEWKDFHRLKARLAFSLTPQGTEPAVGVAMLEGDTTVDKEKRMVAIDNLHIAEARFPSLSDASEKKMEEYLKRTFPSRSMTVSLDRIIAGMERGKAATKTVEVKMEPPQIFVSTEPALLLMIDGKPVEAPLEGTSLKFVVNTTWNLFHDASAYFLLDDKLWLTAPALEGPWTPTAKVPTDLNKLPKGYEDVKKALPAKLTKGTSVPKVIYSATPAELVLFKDSPVYEKVAETHLLWATNTESWFFQNSEDNQFYFLITGRWFRAPSLEGPWTYAGNNLPSDFKLVPPDSKCADILASVPGTEQAQDAVLLAQVPVEAAVKRSEAEAKVKVVYQSEPQFTPIEGTSMSYASNTSSDIIKVQNKYYLCQDAVWFVADAPNGPWKMATEIPPEIYTIPPSSPNYRDTYVKVVDASDPNEVTYSYTSGYYGSYVAGEDDDSYVVWGTGYYYDPYVYWGDYYPIYYPYYRTYGMGAVYNPWTGGYAVGGYGYGPYGGVGAASWYNPNTGRYGRASTMQGEYGGRTRASGYNPRTNTGLSTRQGNNGYAQWGSTAVRRGGDVARAGHIATSDGGVAGYRGPNSSGAVRWGDQGRGGVVKGQDHLYAGRDGNVYRKSEGGGWDKYENGSWQTIDRNDAREKARDSASNRKSGSTSGARKENSSNRSGAIESRRATAVSRERPSTDVMGGLDFSAHSRDRGNFQVDRMNSFQRSAGSFGGSRSFGGGGFRGGGGGFRGGGGRRR
jgi:hypothetical protein